MKSSDRAWDTTHVFGACQVNVARHLYYINIPKCASSWAKAVIDVYSRMGHDQKHARCCDPDLDPEWRGGNFQGESWFRHYRPIVFLRDPWLRWLSVAPARDKIESYWSQRSSITLQHMEDSLIPLLPGFIRDEHLAPQSSFLQGIDLDHADVFWCDHDLTDTFMRYLGTKQFPAIDPVKEKNVSDAEEFRSVREGWKALAQSSLFRQAFRDLYRDDYDLLDTVRLWDNKKIPPLTLQ